MAIEGEKQLAITGGESMAGSGDVKDQKKSDSGTGLKNIISNQVHERYWQYHIANIILVL